MAKGHMPVGQGAAILGQFLEPQNDRVARRIGPGAFAHNPRAGIAIARDRFSALTAFFNRDLKARRDQRTHPIGHQTCAAFVGAAFGPQPQMGHSHFTSPKKI